MAKIGALYDIHKHKFCKKNISASTWKIWSPIMEDLDTSPFFFCTNDVIQRIATYRQTLGGLIPGLSGINS